MGRRMLCVTLVAAVVAMGCKSTADRTVALQIADIVAPTELTPGTPLHLTVTVYSGGCTEYGGVIVDRTDSQVTLHATGTDASQDGMACTSDLRINNVPIDVAPPFTDPLAVVAIQPDGSRLAKSVRIRSSTAQSRIEP